jgi:hypothetical protein
MGSRRRTRARAPDEAIFAEVRKRAVPFDFVLEELEELGPYTKPMFGCTAVYVDDKIVFILRDRPSRPADNGVWVATVREHHASLRAELPSLRSIGVLGDGETGWQILPAGALAFEEHVLHACALVRKRDPRIGKVPKPRRPRVARAKSPRKRARGR